MSQILIVSPPENTGSIMNSPITDYQLTLIYFILFFLIVIGIILIVVTFYISKANNTMNTVLTDSRNILTTAGCLAKNAQLGLLEFCSSVVYHIGPFPILAKTVFPHLCANGTPPPACPAPVPV